MVLQSSTQNYAESHVRVDPSGLIYDAETTTVMATQALKLGSASGSTEARKDVKKCNQCGLLDVCRYS